MNILRIGGIATLAGLFLLVGSIVWPSLDDSGRHWTQADAAVYQETVARLHEGAYLEARANNRRSLHQDNGYDAERMSQHREDKKNIKVYTKKLENARSRPHRIANVLRWSGGGLIAVGACLLLVGRSQDT